MEAGQLVHDEIVFAILRDRMAQDNFTRGVILDGFPRTTVQADALGKMLAEAGQSVSAAISLEVQDDAMVQRVSGRFTCGTCREGYHVDFKPLNRRGCATNAAAPRWPGARMTMPGPSPTA